MDDVLPDCSNMVELEGKLQEKYGRYLQEQPTRTTRARRGGTPFSFLQWLVWWNPAGHVENRVDDEKIPFEARKWNEIEDLGSLHYEQYESARELVLSDWFIRPQTSPKILTLSQCMAWKAWDHWCRMLDINEPRRRLKTIETALNTMIQMFNDLGKEIKLEMLVPPIRVIIENFPEEMPLEIVNGMEVLKGQCARPVYLILSYSECIRYGEFRVVAGLKKWCRMRTRKLVRDNLIELARLVSLIPIEISDFFKVNAWGLINEIKRLVWTQFCTDGHFDTLLLSELRFMSLWKRYTIEDYIAFNFRYEKKDGTSVMAPEGERMTIQEIRNRQSACDRQRKAISLRKLYDHEKIKKEVSLLGGHGPLAKDHEEAKTVTYTLIDHEMGAEHMEEELRAGFPDIRGSNESMETDGSGGQDGSMPSPDPYDGELTLPSSSTESDVQIPPVENLMEPE